MLKALERWPIGGTPANPEGWLYRAARNRVLDRLRSDATAERLRAAADPPDPGPAMPLEGEIADDLLRMMFACCSPSLTVASQVALTLKILGGLSTREIADAFLGGEGAMQKRLVRARRELASEGELVVPHGADLVRRLDGVHHVLYLLFNEGYHSSHSDGLIRRELCAEAIRLTDLLARHPAAGTPTAWALLALQHFHFSRLDERIDAEGRIVLLAEQDRTGWDARAIAAGFRCLAESARGDQLSRYHVEAAIAAEHCRAASVEETDWDRVVELYDRLQAISRSPVHDLNRAVAVLQSRGPEAALEALEAIEDRDVLASYHLLHAVEAECHRQAGDPAASAACLREALRWTRSPHEQGLLQARLAAREAEAAEATDGGGQGH